jgi:hypothetical protein
MKASAWRRDGLGVVGVTVGIGALIRLRVDQHLVEAAMLGVEETSRLVVVAVAARCEVPLAEVPRRVAVLPKPLGEQLNVDRQVRLHRGTLQGSVWIQPAG